MAAAPNERSLVPLAGIALAKLLLHLATARGYGFFRDEFYYLASTNHLEWGYVEHPPLSIALLALSRIVLGDSIVAVRFLPAVAGAATVFMAGLIVRELGGGRRAEWVAALAVLIMPTYLGMSHFYSMNCFDVVFWALLSWMAIRALVHEQPGSWLVFGLIAGLGLMNKVSVGFLGFGFVVGLLLTPQRSQLLRPWPWLGGLIALAIFFPHLVWQMQHSWPTLEFQANARAYKNVSLTMLEFGSEQVLFAGPSALPLWLAGVGGLLFHRRLARVRALGFVYPMLFVLFVAQSGKAYYLTPIYTLIFAAGAIVIEPALEWRRWVAPAVAAALVIPGLAILPMAVPVLSPETYLGYTRSIGIAPPVMEKNEAAALPQTFADMHGWDELVDTVERVTAALPTAERQHAVVLVTNYGEAGAIEFLGAKRDLPPVASGHNSYWLWPPDHFDGPVITLNRTREELEPWFEQIERVDTIECQWCMPLQNDSPVHVVRGLKVPFETFWREMKRYL